MIYLDNAATSYPKPDSVARTMCGALRVCGNPGRSGHTMSLTAGRVIMAAREQLARLINVPDPFRIVFTLNCTDALNMGIKGVVFPGDHVITTALEHNSVLRVLKTLEKRGTLRVSMIPAGRDGFINPHDIERQVQRTTRLIVMTHASNVTGAVQPYLEVADIARRKGVFMLLDAAQTAGTLPLTVTDRSPDMIAMPGHKGLLGPQGTGALYMRPGLFIGTLREGGTGSSSESFYQPFDMPDRYESGTQNTPGLAGLYAGLRFVNAHKQEIFEREEYLTNRLYDGLMNEEAVSVYTPRARRAGLVSFNVRDYVSGQVADRLSAKTMAVRAGLHCAPALHARLGTLERGAVRASVGFFNTENDIDALLCEVRAIIRDPSLIS